MNPILWMCGVIRRVFRIPHGLWKPEMPLPVTSYVRCSVLPHGIQIFNNVIYNTSGGRVPDDIAVQAGWGIAVPSMPDDSVLSHGITTHDATGSLEAAPSDQQVHGYSQSKTESDHR